LISLLVLAQDPKVGPNEALLICVVTDDQNVPEKDAVVIVESEDKIFKATGTVNIDGEYKLVVPQGKKYKFIVQKFNKDFDFDDYTEIPEMDGPFSMTMNLAIKLVTKYLRTYKLDNVYFDSNKYDLKNESIAAINKLQHALKTNPKMKVEIAGHTDDLGDDVSNMRLSQRRADAIVEYLISKGIEKNRVIAKGYGETQPAVPNTSDANRAQNRRTEVKVIEE
ncbi:MAG: OmpA family protein, partial [Cytophagaceae bacterium]